MEKNKSIILIIIGLIIIALFLLPLFRGSSFNIGTTTGLCIGTILFFYGFFFTKVNHFITWFWKKSVGKIIELFVGVILLVIIGLAIATTICMIRAASIPSFSNGTVIVLGCKVNKTTPSIMLGERLDAAYKYLNENPKSHVIVSGGQGKGEDVSEAFAMHKWLTNKGIDSSRIILEDTSTDTHENLTNCAKIIDDLNSPNYRKDNVVIITNEFHEYRSLKQSVSLGFVASPYPAKTAWWLFPTFYIREMYGILEYWFLS